MKRSKECFPFETLTVRYLEMKSTKHNYICHFSATFLQLYLHNSIFNFLSQNKFNCDFKFQFPVSNFSNGRINNLSAALRTELKLTTPSEQISEVVVSLLISSNTSADISRILTSTSAKYTKEITKASYYKVSGGEQTRRQQAEKLKSSLANRGRSVYSFSWLFQLKHRYGQRINKRSSGSRVPKSPPAPPRFCQNQLTQIN